ncbi:unnamed protein product, partial [Timema podura]|nr:unnamed protein product [Timema podura]
GILAPKIEVSTKTTIEEVTKSSCSSQDISCNIINPKMLSSKGCTLPKRRKKVFHSIYQPKKCPKLRGRSCRLKKPPTARNHCNHPHKHPSCFPPEHCPPFKHDRRHKCYACLEQMFSIEQTYKDDCLDASPSQPLTWCTASGRIYNSHTFCKTVNRPERARPIVDCSHSHKREDCFPHSRCDCKNHTPGKCTVCNAYNKYFKPAGTYCCSHCPQTIKKNFPCPNSRCSRICDKYTPSDNSTFEDTLPCSPRCGQTSYTRHCTVDSGKAVNKSLQCGDVKLDGGTKLHDLATFNNQIKPSWKPCKPAPQPRSCPPCPAKSVLEPKSCPQGLQAKMTITPVPHIVRCFTAALKSSTKNFTIDTKKEQERKPHVHN